MGSTFTCRVLLCLLFVSLSSVLFAQRPIDELMVKYKAKPKMGMKIQELTEDAKDQTIEAFEKYRAFAPSGLYADYYKNLLDVKIISCEGASAQNFYNEVIAFFDTQKGYTSSRSRMGGVRSKGYTIIYKDAVTGKKVKETNTALLNLPEEGKPESSATAAIMTIVTNEEP